MGYTVNPVVELVSADLSGPVILYDHYHKRETRVGLEALALLCDAKWPLSIINPGKTAERFLDDAKSVDTIVNQLIAQNIIVDEETAFAKAADYWISHGWGASLIYHLSSQRIEHRDDKFHRKNDLSGLKDEILSHTSTTMIEWVRKELKFTVKAQKTYQLKKHLLELGKSYDDVINARSSFKPYTSQTISLDELSHIFWASNRFNHENRKYCYDNIIDNPDLLCSSLFSALEIYLFVRGSDASIETGLYHFNSYDFTLDKMYGEDIDSQIKEACAGQVRAIGGVLFLLYLCAYRPRLKAV